MQRLQQHQVRQVYTWSGMVDTSLRPPLQQHSLPQGSPFSTWLPLLTRSPCNLGSTTQMQITRGSNSARPSLNKISQTLPAAEKCEMKFPSWDGWILSATSKHDGSLEQAELSPSIDYFWLHWVFIAMCRLSLVVMSRGYSPVVVRRLLFSLQWHILLQSTRSRVCGLQ